MSERTRILQRIQTLRDLGMPVPLLLEKRLGEFGRKKRYPRRRLSDMKRATKNTKGAQFYRTREWKMVRYDVLAERGGRCECCGATAKDGVRLNVDHIVPLSRDWGRRLDKNNLQVLCGSCNAGKGARRTDDWRSAA